MKIKSCYWKKSGIYVIMNTFNYKKYIGSSKDIYHRLHKHNSQLKRNIHSNPYLQNVWNKDNECLTCFLLEECNEDKLIEREQHWINKINPEYNINRDIFPTYIPSQETKDKISEYSKQMWKDKKFINVYTKIKVYKLVEEYVGDFDSIKEASEKLEVNYHSIQNSLSGKYKRFKGHPYVFYYQ